MTIDTNFRHERGSTGGAFRRILKELKDLAYGATAMVDARPIEEDLVSCSTVHFVTQY
jgi:hypothetical protein